MKTAVVLFSLPFLLITFSGCASLTGRTAGEIIDDSKIVTLINAKIIEDPELSYLKINVNSTSGNVVLTGFVPNKAAEKRLVEISRQIRGVRSVKSELNVQPTN